MGIHTAGANASGQGQIIPLVIAFPNVGGKAGRSKVLPDTLEADTGYDYCPIYGNPHPTSMRNR